MKIVKKETNKEIWTYYTQIYTQNHINSILKKIIHIPTFILTNNSIWLYHINKYYTIYNKRNNTTITPNINILIKKITNITQTYSLNYKYLTIIHKQIKNE
nr:hypothetical protein [Cassiopea sp. MKL-2023]